MSIKKLDRRQQTENLRNVRFNEKDDVNVADMNWLIDEINNLPTAVNTDRWLISDIAIVSPSGDDLTGMAGDGNLPYQTVRIAMLNADKVIVLPGDYTETVTLLDGKDIYCMPGVEFTSGGFRAISSITASVLGSAVFSGSSNALTASSDSNVYFQFDRMDNNRTVLEATFDCNIVMVGNSILCHGLNGFGGAMTIRDNANVTMRITNFFHGQHRLSYFRAGGIGAYAGKFEITCPDMRILPNYQASYGNLAKSVFGFDACAGATIIINGNMSLDHNVLGSGTTGCIGIDNHFVTNTIIVNGNMSGGVANTCIWTGVRARVDDIIVNGDLHADNNFVVYLTLTGGDGPEGPLRITFNGSKFTGDAYPLHIRDGKEIYFRDCSFYNGDTQAGAESIQYVASNGLPSELYFYNCIAQNAASAVGAEFISGGAAIGILGCHNVICADPLGVGAVDTFAGYTQLAGVKTPNF